MIDVWRMGGVAAARPPALALAAGAMLAMAHGGAFAGGMPAHGALAQHAAGPPAPARTIRIYRCTDALGRVTLQNDTPCPEGTRQEVQSVEPPTPMPTYVPREDRMPDIVAAERAADAAAIAAAVQSAAAAPAATPAPAVANAADGAAADAKAAPAEPGPPPALYACRTWDDADYLTEDAKPAERCAPLQVVGMDGIARADAAACEKTVDQCAAVPAEGLCQAWRRRVDEAEFRWKFAGAKQDDDRRREYELLEATLAHSDCTR
jgi:hypothetical protein